MKKQPVKKKGKNISDEDLGNNRIEEEKYSDDTIDLDDDAYPEIKEEQGIQDIHTWPEDEEDEM
jgi:hypothetical protein